MNTAVKVENLSKIYTISHLQGIKQNVNETMHELLGNAFKDIFLPTEKITNEEFFALKNINFEIKEGEKVGFIGKNGAGKSTLLKILSRVTLPTSGQVTMYGKVASILEVGTGFHPELSGRENTFLNGAILGMTYKEIKRSFKNIVEFAEIERFIDTPVKRYSAGMRVRLAFAIAAHLNADILILDEVLSVGDRSFAQKCFAKMDEITNQHGRTILFVSHLLDQITRVCNRGILLEGGMITADGPLDSVLEKYNNLT